MCRIIRKSDVVNSLDTIKHSLKTIPEKVRRDIQRSKPGKAYEIPSHVLCSGTGGHLTHAFQEVLYSCGLNGGQQVNYERDKGITIESEGVEVLKDVLSYC